MAIQGMAISKFGAVSIQTIVVTNSMVKFADAFAGRYLEPRSAGPSATVPRPGLQDLILPGSAWLAYLSAAVAGAFIVRTFAFPLLLPAVILVGVIVDLTRTDPMDLIQLPPDAAQ